jgi:hypothetical protein
MVAPATGVPVESATLPDIEAVTSGQAGASVAAKPKNSRHKNNQALVDPRFGRIFIQPALAPGRFSRIGENAYTSVCAPLFAYPP